MAFNEYVKRVQESILGHAELAPLFDEIELRGSRLAVFRFKLGVTRRQLHVANELALGLLPDYGFRLAKRHFGARGSAFTQGVLPARKENSLELTHYPY